MNLCDTNSIWNLSVTIDGVAVAGILIIMNLKSLFISCYFLLYCRESLQFMANLSDKLTIAIR